jgi:hypothetical protein
MDGKEVEIEATVLNSQVPKQGQIQTRGHRQQIYISGELDSGATIVSAEGLDGSLSQPCGGPHHVRGVSNDWGSRRREAIQSC